MRMSIIAAIALAATTLAPRPANATSRKADQIARNHLAAIGGDRFQEVVAVRVDGTVEVHGVSASFTLWRQRPDLSRVEMSILGQDIVQAYDGETAWWINPVVGSSAPSEMPEDFAREMAFWSDFDGPLVDYAKKRSKLRYLGEEELDTGKAYKIRVAMADGEEVYVYIDGKTYLEVKRTHTQYFHGEATAVDTYFSDFAEFGGIIAPQKIEGVGFAGERFTMRLGSIELDVESDASRFNMPGRAGSGD
jgi:hypothetical protein